MNTKGLPRILRVTKRTRQAIGVLAFSGWVIYLGIKFMRWFDAGGYKTMQEWSRK